MISTVSAVSTVTSVSTTTSTSSAVASGSLAGITGPAVTAILLATLVAKELAKSGSVAWEPETIANQATLFDKTLSVGALPLLIVFICQVASSLFM